MHIELPWHSHFPDPGYVKDLEHKAIMLDVGVLLRGILFCESHSARLLESIERSFGATAVICPHVSDTALEVLESYELQHLTPQFTAGLLGYIKRGTIVVKPNGDTESLPPDVAFDPKDDDIVIATAISHNCNALATLDKGCADHGGKIIKILLPSQPEYSHFFPTTTTINVPIFAGSKQGSLLMQVMPKEGTTSYKATKGRRYVLFAGDLLGIWLNESTWRYEVGIQNKSEPLFIFKELPLYNPILLAVSYDCKERRLIAGCDALDGSPPETELIKGRYLPSSIESFGILSRGEKDSFNGYWQGVLSTHKFIGKSAMNFSLKHKFHFEALDAQRFKIPDAVFEPAVNLER